MGVSIWAILGVGVACFDICGEEWVDNGGWGMGRSFQKKFSRF